MPHGHLARVLVLAGGDLFFLLREPRLHLAHGLGRRDVLLVELLSLVVNVRELRLELVRLLRDVQALHLPDGVHKKDVYFNWF